MKLKPSWEQKTVEFDGAVINYRLPGYSVIAEFMQKFGDSIGKDGSVREMLNVSTEMIVWMITGWTGIETDTNPPKPIDFSEKNLRDLLDFDVNFKETLIEKTAIMDHMTSIRSGYARKVLAEKKNLHVFTKLMWMLRRNKKGEEVHAVKIEGKTYMRDAIRLMPANFEAVRILGMMNTLNADFFTSLAEYERLTGVRYDEDGRYVLQEKISYVEELMDRFSKEAEV